MEVWQLIFVSIGLSLDVFSVAICKGLSVRKLEMKHLIVAGFWAGGAHIIMPLIGYFLGSSFHNFTKKFDYWFAFAVLVLLGVHLIIESNEKLKKTNSSFSTRFMLPLAISDSTNALALGVTYGFEEVHIIPAVCIIGVTAFIMAAFGIKIGNRFGAKYKAKAEITGGIILIAMAFLTLADDLGIFL